MNSEIKLLISVFLIAAAVMMASCRGNDGLPGQSIVGPQGPMGSDAASVTAVPLCPGDSSYGTFVEVAYCINNNLYATYSANGGFSTVLVPGTYVSNGINSSCYFTVVSGCTITH